ncbi:MAG: hypothetical protein JOZ42_02680 [Acetobacteraceae bacterium]|nr:hypothetical protein [Acetobacteraceae bacterium]
MRRGRITSHAAVLAFALAGVSCATKPPLSVYPNAILLDQGPRWNDVTRASFYAQDQGARIIPLAWLQALKQTNGQGFLNDGLSRYGYLPNQPNGLPVGFVSVGTGRDAVVGMTCSACHTRQITVDNVPYRVDGGPAIVDFQSFLSDLDAAVGTVLSSDSAFADFATGALGHAPAPAETAQLRQSVSGWYYPYHTLMSRALPSTPWGPSRLDAVGMIFNRLTGLDIGSGTDRVIADNIRRADAPVRYPFLWNSPVQDFTQWPGFAQNGSDLLALSRNVGEVYGVFAMYRPQKNAAHVFGYDYLNGNSVNFSGLRTLNLLTKNLGPPKWPFAIDAGLATQGAAVFNRSIDAGGCVACHGIRPGQTRLGNATWATPIQDVGTDSREYDVLSWTASTGVLQGARIPLVISSLQPVDKSINILTLSVVGSILQDFVPVLLAPRPGTLGAQAQTATPSAEALVASPEAAQLRTAFRTAPQPKAAYESRVLQGIWATAPYLHNGSVPTLADLLKPAAERPASFPIGPAYDTSKVGLAASQTVFGYTLQTTDCSDRNSGASRCGHEYGTTLPDADKRALLEYLKSL